MSADPEPTGPAAFTADRARRQLAGINKFERLIMDGDGGISVGTPSGPKTLTGLEGLTAVGLTRLGILAEVAAEILALLEQPEPEPTIELDEVEPGELYRPFGNCVLMRGEAAPIAMATLAVYAREIADALNAQHQRSQK